MITFGGPSGLQYEASSALGNELYLTGSNSLEATATDLLFDFSNESTFKTQSTEGAQWCVAGVGFECGWTIAEMIGPNPDTYEYTEITFYDPIGWVSIASVSTVPLPASLPLMVAAFGGFAFVGRRAAKKAK